VCGYGPSDCQNVVKLLSNNYSIPLPGFDEERFHEPCKEISFFV